MLKKWLFIIFVLCAGRCLSQDNRVDSLKHELQRLETLKEKRGNSSTGPGDTTRADIMYELVRANYCSDSEQAMFYAQQCLSFSKKINYPKGVGNAYNGMGLILMCRHHPEEAVSYFQLALNVRSKINDRAGMAWTYNNLGLVYGDDGNYPMSVIQHTHALQLRQTLGDTELVEVSYCKRADAYKMLGNYPKALDDLLNALKTAQALNSQMRIAEDYRAVAEIYDRTRNYNEALKNYTLSSKVATEIGNPAYIAVAALNLGEINFKQGDYAGALKNYQYSLKLREENKLSDYEIALMYNKIALVYFKQGVYPEALKSCQKALDFYEKINARYETAFSYNLLADIYFSQNKANDALKYATKGLAVAQQANAHDLKEKGYEDLARINAALKNYKAAYDNEVLFKQEYDTLYNKENDRNLTRLQMQYDFGRQQDSLNLEQSKKDALSQQQIQRQKAYTGIGIAGFVLLSLLLFFVYRNYINQRKATEAMALARQRAEQSEKFKEKFLANMSHEIRTPMNAVLGMANLTLDTPLNDKQYNYISAIKKSSENLLVILNDILDLSKLEAGKMQLEKLPFRMRGQVKDVMEMMRFKAEEKGLQFTCEIADDVPEVVTGDAVRLSEVLLNLLGNAIKFTSSGFVKLEVSATPYHTGEAICNIVFRITDTGIGMSDEQQQRIFESFVQGDSDISRKFGGTGLGLAISKTLIELQGGAISVKSELGKTSEFEFNIPYPVAAVGDLVQPAPRKQPEYTSLANKKLLVVEDNEFNQVVIKDTLENLLPGISITIAANGKLAVEQLKQQAFDLVLMDVHMPEMDGYEATRYIRNELKLDIPVIALTASVIRGDLDKCTEAGMNGYIPKPFKRTELLDELIKHLSPANHG